MTLPDASVGSILAATVAGAIALISLIVSKENKTSEFRQLWIDSLRSELAVFISCSLEIYRNREWGRDHSDENWESTSKYYSQINETITKIRLRLNPSEKISIELLEILKKYEKAFSENKIPTWEELSALNHQFTTASQKLLKKEWRRVRNGELVFQLVRATSFAIFVSGLGFILFEQLGSR